jgi:prenyltransferase beta subunit
VSWQLGSTALVALALAGGVAWYERGRPGSRLVSLVAALAALATAARILFTPVPNVQGTTDVALLSGYALGPGPGFAVGALGALASNFFLGQGPWTPWQMVGWGAVGVAGAAIARLSPGRTTPAVPGRSGRLALAAACGFAGLAFGAWMDLFTVLNFTADRSGDTYVAVAAASLPFNLAHAAGNVLLCLLFGPGFVRLLARYRRRFEVRWGPAPAAAAALAVAVLAAGAAPQTAEAASGARAAVSYLVKAQNRDGGFGAAPGTLSSQLLTGWAVIGLEAAGRNPLDVRRGGHSPIGFMRTGARGLEEAGEIERTILALRGAGVSARRFGGRDLVAGLRKHQRRDGSFEGQVNWTAYGVLALRAARMSARGGAVRRAARWLARQQNADGGFSFSRKGGASDSDDTGAVLQALAAAGKRRSAAVRRAVAYLHTVQNPDGGVGQLRGTASNAQSTAWAAQGLVAAGRDPGRFRRRGSRSALAYLRSLQHPDGSFRYSRTSAQTPVWVTAQALVAIRRRTLPLTPVPRRRAHRSAAVEPVARKTKAPAPRAASRRQAASARPQARSPRAAVSSEPVAVRAPARRREGRREPDGALDAWVAVPLAGIAAAAAIWLGRRRLRRRTPTIGP